MLSLSMCRTFWGFFLGHINSLKRNLDCFPSAFLAFQHNNSNNKKVCQDNIRLLSKFSVCLSISSPASQSLFPSFFEAAMCGIAFIRVCFFLRSGFAFTDLPSFPPRPCPSLLFASQKHPGRSLHPLICSETVLSACSCSLSRVFSSLPSFICLSGPLVRQRSSRNFPRLPIPPSNCSPLLYPRFLLCCSLSSHFSTVVSRHSVLEIVANKTRC